jgi:hypothetical protein
MYCYNVLYISSDDKTLLDTFTNKFLIGLINKNGDISEPSIYNFMRNDDYKITDFRKSDLSYVFRFTSNYSPVSTLIDVINKFGLICRLYYYCNKNDVCGYYVNGGWTHINYIPDNMSEYELYIPKILDITLPIRQHKIIKKD